MIYQKKIMRYLFMLFFLLLLTTQLPSFSLAASQDKPITGKEWAATWGLDWGPKYWPTQPVSGVFFKWPARFISD
jgi:hypothetical protein